MFSKRHCAAAVVGLASLLVGCGAAADAPVPSSALDRTAPPALALVPEPTLEPASLVETPAPQPSPVEQAAFPTPEQWQPAPQQPLDTAPSPGSTTSPTAPNVDSPATAPAGESYPLGACLGSLATGQGESVVPCTEPHLVEVYHVGQFVLAEGVPHPGEDLVALAMEQCAPSFEALPGVAQSGVSYDVQIHAPSVGQWESGERFLACLLVFPEPVDQPLADLDRTPAPANVGDCFEGDVLASRVPISCQQPHNFEVYATTGLLGLPEAESFCRRALGDEALFVDFTRSWQADVVVGETQVECYLFSAEPTTGSVFEKPVEE